MLAFEHDSVVFDVRIHTSAGYLCDLRNHVELAEGKQTLPSYECMAHLSGIKKPLALINRSIVVD